jgi:hypothetical protein
MVLASAVQAERDAYFRIVREFVLDVEAVYGTDMAALKEQWPDLLATYQNALLVLRKAHDQTHKLAS